MAGAARIRPAGRDRCSGGAASLHCHFKTQKVRYSVANATNARFPPEADLHSPDNMPVTKLAATLEWVDRSASLYEPINVYKPEGLDIGVVDGPFEYLTVARIRLPLPFTTRMTVVRLLNGDLFLHSPIKFDAALAEQLQELGQVRHLVSPISFTTRTLSSGLRRIRTLVTWASPRVRQRARARRIDVRFDHDFAGNAASRLAARPGPGALSGRLLQGVYFLPPFIKDADPHGHHHQPRTGQDR